MRKHTLLCISVLIVAATLPGCPGNQPSATYKLYVCVTAPFPDYDMHQLVVSPTSKPNGIDQTGSLHLTEGSVLALDGLVSGENYELSIFVSTSPGITWTLTGHTGVVSGDVHWLIYEDGSGALQGLVNAIGASRALQP